MTLKLEEAVLAPIEVLEQAREGDTAVMLTTYVDTYNQQLETYLWMKEKGYLAGNERQWRTTLEGLRTIARALDAGFDPYTPPADWFSGVMARYNGPIPSEVRAKIDIAVPIFGANRILIHDPRAERFQKVLDPIATGHVDLEGIRTHFLLGQWDLDEDFKFIEGQQKAREQAALNLANVVTAVNARWIDSNNGS